LASMSDRLNLGSTVSVDARPDAAIVLEDVWLKFRLRYYKRRNTLRGAAVAGLHSLLSSRRAERGDDFWALRGLNLAISEGEVAGIVGQNGAGKSTLLRVIAGIYSPDRGRVVTRGSISTLLSFGAGFDVRRPGRENIYKNGILLGLNKERIDERMDAIVEMSGLGQFIDAPVMTYSSGMRARLGFSIAIHVEPDILLIDEVVSAGDEKFRHRVGNIFDQFVDKGRTIVFVTHSLALLEQYCSRAIWVDEGMVRLDGPPADVAGEYVAASKSDS